MVETFYDKDEDILNIQLKESGYWKSVELPNGIVLDIAEDGTIVAFEIIKASKLFAGDLRKVIEAATVAAN
jgi:uncharacterized protein YuzE